MSESYRGLTVPEYTDPADGPGGFRALVDSGPIARFATTTDRDNAIPAPVVGIIVWVTAAATFQYWTGSTWENLTGDSAPAVHTHSGTQITSGVVPEARLPNASTSAQGVVQLSVSTSSTSSTLAATASAVRSAYNVGNHAHPYVPTSGDSTISGELTVTQIQLTQGTPTAPALVLLEQANDTGIYGNDSLQRVGVTIDGGAAGDYVFSSSGFTSLASGKDLGASAYPWDRLYANQTVVARINDVVADDLIAALRELADEARSRGVTVTAV